ncbi:hypothetical protein NDU88_001975 [Pleurodeles waltl]|uniref:Uncharacterized protein n=1 Tax=Pleurodeles waltl TaxID=8319 RepID=A0AAV7U9G6_PLEWA|nr:hypothetical protein NDU88_001975 [Pleurodeles waltl]
MRQLGNGKSQHVRRKDRDNGSRPMEGDARERRREDMEGDAEDRREKDRRGVSKAGGRGKDGHQEES